MTDTGSTVSARPAAAAVAFKVSDMTCGHCAATITKAIESAVPGARAAADPTSKIVSVTGAPDAAALDRIIREAGYTPAAA